MPTISLRQKILLVDDDDRVRSVIARYLRNKGFDIMQAASGADACREWHSGCRPDVVVTDFKMPDMNGMELIENLRADGYTGPFLLISGFREEIQPLANDDISVLDKPMSGRDLLAALKQSLGTREM